MSQQVYRQYTRDELELNFDPQKSVPDSTSWSDKRNTASAKNRQELKSFLDVPYGASPRQKLDIYPAARPGAPVLVYFHGGYWRSGGKEQNAHFAPLFVKAGATVVVAGYDLCPNVTVTDIVRQARSAIAWVDKNISRYGGDPANLYIAGISAGGHLVAMTLAHDWEKDGLPRNIIKGAAAITGVYDLDAVLHIGVNEEIRLTPESARENSPLRHPPGAGAPLIVAVGGAEPEGWRGQSREFFRLCRESGVDCEFIEIPGAHHYSMGLELMNPASPLTRAMLKQIGIAA
ncbi:MAG TPA: alpha/beta hydrolase [Verrucomicrobiae bacterium]|jgi:arylformamidase|nr:alpha/beta hydrolase [Verrucomicrobiae bacterium]